MKLATDDVGHGHSIIFIHGFPHNRALWSAQLAAFKATNRCIAPDLRGFGESEVTPP